MSVSLSTGRLGTASSSPANACCAPGRTIQLIRQRLSLDKGRVSMISTTSPQVRSHGCRRGQCSRRLRPPEHLARTSDGARAVRPRPAGSCSSCRTSRSQFPSYGGCGSASSYHCRACWAHQIFSWDLIMRSFRRWCERALEGSTLVLYGGPKGSQPEIDFSLFNLTLPEDRLDAGDFAALALTISAAGVPPAARSRSGAGGRSRGCMLDFQARQQIRLATSSVCSRSSVGLDTTRIPFKPAGG